MRLIFWTAIFLGSALLFLVQPMVAKLVLPALGGGPGIWTACMLFFQTALLGGYLVAHLLARLGRRAQLGLFAGALALPVLAAVLSQRAIVSLPAGWSPPVDGSPVPWLLAFLAVTVGAPFVALSAASPLLQRWFSWGGQRGSGDPYSLYVASNAGSMLALLAYPLLVEPALPLALQRGAWTAAYVVFLLLAIACGMLVRRQPVSPVAGVRPAATALAPTALTRARWVVLALVPSSLVLGLTQFVTTDVAAFPLLWVIPLALYLGTYIVAFSRLGPAATRLATRALPVATAILVILLLLAQSHPMRAQIALHLAGLVLAGLACHGRLAAARPAPERLTEFYLLLSLGGVLGGAFNALAAPFLFTGVAEYPIAILAAALLGGLARYQRAAWPPRFLDLVAPVVLVTLYHLVPDLMRWLDAAGGVVRIDVLGEPLEIGWKPLLQATLPALAGLAFLRRPVGFALGLGALLLASAVSLPGETRRLHAERTFFGVHRVFADASGTSEWHSLWHGSIQHGRQYQEPPRSLRPSSYYFRSGPAGDVMREMGRRWGERSMAFVGLGCGTLAAYGRSEWSFDFYEIDPAVARIASDPVLFSYLTDSPARISVILGDARLALGRAPGARYDLIALDAFSGDAIPVHLLTRQAIELYLAKLRPGGLLAFHITNQYMRLAPVLASAARALDLAIVLRSDFDLSEQDRLDGKFGSDWVVLARRPEDLGALATDPRWWTPDVPDGFREWTDDYSDILSVLAFR